MSAMTALRASLSVLLATVVVGVSTPAFADSPSSWNPGPSRTLLENVVFFGGWFVGLYVVIWFLAYALSRSNFVPEPPEPGSEVQAHGHH